VAFLRDLARGADQLIVGCASDALAAADGAPCLMGFDDRRALLERCRHVSRVIAQTGAEQVMTDIVNYNVGVLAVGPEHHGSVEDLQDIAQVLRLPGLPVKQYSTSPVDYSRPA
jgi:glycerol-3-phosphate cytidylyltransferase-like family protein